VSYIVDVSYRTLLPVQQVFGSMTLNGLIYCLYGEIS